MKRATGATVAELIQTLLSHGNMNYRVKIQDESGGLRDIVVSSATDYPAQVILSTAPTKRQTRRAR